MTHLELGVLSWGRINEGLGRDVVQSSNLEKQGHDEKTVLTARVPQDASTNLVISHDVGSVVGNSLRDTEIDKL